MTYFFTIYFEGPELWISTLNFDKSENNDIVFSQLCDTNTKSRNLPKPSEQIYNNLCVST